MFLIRTAFWLSLIILLIPTGEADNQGVAKPDLSAYEAITAARHTVSDLAGFCDRNPDTCETGTTVAKTFGQKAQRGAQLLYEYLSETDFGGAATREDSVPGVDTLQAIDRDIPWQGTVEGTVRGIQQVAGAQG